MSYQPSQKILNNYAQVLVNFALNSGHGVKPGEVVQCVVPDVAKPLALELQNEILKAGAHPMMKIIPTGFDNDFYTLANDEQLTFFPEQYMRERVNVMDHQIGILADPYPKELAEVDPAKIIKARDAKKKYIEWRSEKEVKGKFTWVLALWGVQAKADEVGLPIDEYWQQIIEACFLDADDPIQSWKEIFQLQQEIKVKLNALEIDYIHAEGEDMDIKVKLGANRVWKMGGGCNIPSFECFTSPDWRGTEGWIRFNQPLYRYGNVLKDIYLRFEKGLVVEAKAKEGDQFLQQMMKSPNANKLGEYSLTDKRMSRITHVMAETLYDENIGGKYGNTHLAVGRSFKECYRGDKTQVSSEQWQEMGFNDSAEHTDIISTTDRVVTAYLTDGSKKVIYKDGQFTL